MPLKDRDKHLDYLTEYRKKHRPAPEPISRGDLPPMGKMVFSADGTKVQCHVCGRWYGALNMHLRVHDLDGAAYKEEFGIARTASMLPPVTQEKYRQATIARDQGSIGRDYLPPAKGRAIGIKNRLSTQVDASVVRKGVNLRGGEKLKR